MPLPDDERPQDRGYVPPPGESSPPPGGDGIRRYEPRWLRPNFFGLASWRDLEVGLSPAQANAIYYWLDRIDTPNNQGRYATGTFARDMLRQARERVYRELPGGPEYEFDRSETTPYKDKPPVPRTEDTYVEPPPPVVAPGGGGDVIPPGGGKGGGGGGYVQPPPPVVSPPDPFGDPAVKPPTVNLASGYDYVWNPTGRFVAGQPLSGQWEARLIGSGGPAGRIGSAAPVTPFDPYASSRMSVRPPRPARTYVPAPPRVIRTPNPWISPQQRAQELNQIRSGYDPIAAAARRATLYARSATPVTPYVPPPKPKVNRVIM